MWTLKVAAESSMSHILVEPGLQIIWLYSAGSPGVFFAEYHSRLTFRDLRGLSTGIA